MPVSSTSRKAGPFAGNGVAKSFPFTFKVFAASDVAVYHTDAAGVQTKLTTGYTVTLNLDQDTSPGGSITYPYVGAPMAANEQLDVIGALPYLQGVDIRNASTYQASVIQRALDYLAVLCQQLLERVNRSLTFPVGDASSTTLPTAAERAGGSLAFDADGKPIVGPALGDLVGEVEAAAASASDAATQVGLATAQAEAAATSAAASAGSADAAHTSEINAGSSANTAAIQAAASSTASATSGAYPNAAATDVPRGLTQASVGAITPGAGGTNGTFNVAWTGGNFSINPTATFTVAGGVLTAFTVTGPGLYIGSAPTVPTPSFAASAGLAGAAVALTPQFLITSGQGYWVQSGDGTKLDRYKNVSGFAISDTSGVSSIPSWALVDDIYSERLFAAQARFFTERRTHNRDVSHKKALVAIYLGQSNGTGGVNAQTLSGTPSLNAYMPAAGPYLGYYQFYSGNIEYPTNWADVGSAVQYVEGVSEGPCGGLIAGLDGLYGRLYVASAAIGGQSLLKLMGSGLRCNLYALMHKLCDHARAAGYEPEVVMSTAHGEANMGSFGDMSEADYYLYAPEYYRDAQKAAAQAMQRPDWRAPIIFHNPAQNGTAACWKIHRAIVRAAAEVENAILSCPINQWQVNGDGVHNSAVGYRERGEWDAYLIRRFLQDGVRKASPKLVQAVRNGTSVTLTFDQEVMLRTQGGAFNLGSGLNVGVALNGVEFVDNGGYIAITPASMVFNGRTVTFSIDSEPVGAAGAQEVRIGMQAGVQSQWPNLISGSPIAAADDNGEPSIWDPTKRSYHYVVPYSVTVR